MFTNIPLKETIEDVCKHLYQQHDQPKYPIEIFRKLLQIATGGYFLDRGKLYCQIDGITIGSALGPTLANCFLAQLENQFINTNLNFLHAHCRYVCDIFCVFDCLENVTKFS